VHENPSDVPVHPKGQSPPGSIAPSQSRLLTAKDTVMSQSLASGAAARQAGLMFTIEHEFDATVITLLDEGTAPLQEDITINSFAECVTIEQLDPRTGRIQLITLSLEQLRDLSVALDLPEGAYQLRNDPE